MTGAMAPLRERDEQLLVADVLDLVALELAQRVAHHGLVVGLGEHDVDDQADGESEEEASDDEFHVVVPSDPDVDDLAHPDVPDAGGDHGGAEHDVAQPVVSRSLLVYSLFITNMTSPRPTGRAMRT